MISRYCFSNDYYILSYCKKELVMIGCCFRPRFCTYKATLGRGQIGLLRWIFVWILPLVQDRSLDMLTRSLPRTQLKKYFTMYHPDCIFGDIWMKIGLFVNSASTVTNTCDRLKFCAIFDPLICHLNLLFMWHLTYTLMIHWPQNG